MTPPLMLTDYRARCCGTCKHFSDGQYEYGDLCKLDETVLCDRYSICMSNYEPEEY